MQRLDIDFQASTGKLPSAGVAVLVIAVLAGLALLLLQRDLSGQLAEMDTTLGHSAASEKSRAMSGRDAEGDRELRAAFNQLVLPWGEVFAAVEDATEDRVLLLGLEGDGRNRLVRITAQAPHAEDMLAYLERLKTSRKLGGWRLLSHSEDDKRMLRFVIQADLPEGL